MIRFRTLFLRDTGPGWSVATHAHDGAWQWYLCLGGALEIGAGQACLRLRPGQSMVVRPGVLRRLRSGGGPTSYLVAILEWAALDLSPIAHRILRPGRRLAALQRTAADGLRTRQAADRLLAQAQVLVILVELLRQGPADAQVPASEPAMHPAVIAAEDFLTRHAHRPVSLAEVATAAGVSTPHLARLFRSERRCSVMQAARRLRLERARELLAQDDRPVTAIAIDVGFTSFSHFAALFRRAFGTSPSAWRGHAAMIRSGTGRIVSR